MDDLGDLGDLASELGVERGYWDVRGAWHEPSPEALVALVGVLGWPIDRPAEAAAALASLRADRAARVVEPVVVVRAGERTVARVRPAPTEVQLTSEDGDALPVEVAVDVAVDGGGAVVSSVVALPVGYHRLDVSTHDGDGVAHVIVAPPTVRSPEPGRRSWGVFAPLHGLGPSPTFGDLDRLGAWVHGLGGDVVATLPLLETFPWEPSPYAPVTRAAWSSRWIDPHGVDWPAPAAGAGADTLEVWGLGGPAWAELRRWVDRRPHAVELARFRARARRAGGGWRHADFDRSLDDVALGAAGAGRCLVEQHLAEQQLRAVADHAAARGQRLYLDLPLGSHPDGFDTFRRPDLYASGASAGAPPDDFFSGGQNWGFPPVLPEAARADGHRALRDDLAHHMQVAGMLRIDHVMQLHRLFWIPDGADGRDGAYVRAPRDELFAVLAVESTRHGCELVGEDLGTVPEEVRHALADHDMCGMWVAEFAVDSWAGAELRLPGPRTVASVDTHDTPTFAGWRRGHDLDLLDDLGLLDADAAASGRRDRRQQVENLTGWLAARRHLAADHTADTTADTEVHAALLEAIGESDAELVLVTVEDLWAEVEPQNVPGTPSDRPNWVQQLRVPVADLPGYEPGEAVLRRLDRARKGGTAPDRHDREGES